MSARAVARRFQKMAVSSLEAERTRRDAVGAGLIVHRTDPLNCETDLRALIGGVVMPSARFYVRNHFDVPRLDAGRWRLAVRGHVGRPVVLSLPELRSMPSQTVVATLECAGNGRSRFDPPAPGDQWQLGAVSTAEWTGVPLRELLERCRPGARARHIVFRGADRGFESGSAAPIRYERSLSLEEAMRSEALLAYAMNGEPLPAHHGHPLRLVVPGWFAMASVKWLAEIELIDHEFAGYFHAEAYVYEDRRGVREPVERQNVRSVIIEPAAGERRPMGPLMIRGVAWSGEAAIRRVEVKVGDAQWTPTSLIGQRARHSWRWWELLTCLEQPGTVTIRARATDEAGRTQPDRAPWNRMGYGNNGVQAVEVQVR